MACGFTATRMTDGGCVSWSDGGKNVDTVVGEEIGDRPSRIGILHDDGAGIETAGEQSRQDRSAHLARAGEQQRTLHR